MSREEEYAVVGRLVIEHHETVEKRLRVVERVKQVASALNKLALAIDRKPDFNEVCKDSILQEYLDLSRIGELVLEEQRLSALQEDYETRMRAMNIPVRY
jgi:hypothetical protein